MIIINKKPNSKITIFKIALIGGIFLFASIPLILSSLLPISLNSSILETDTFNGAPTVYETIERELALAERDSESRLFWSSIGKFFTESDFGNSFRRTIEDVQELDNLFFIEAEESEDLDKYAGSNNMVMNTLGTIFKVAYANALDNARAQVVKLVDGVYVADNSKLGVNSNGTAYVDNRIPTSPVTIIDTGHPLFNQHGPNDEVESITFHTPIATPDDATMGTYLKPAIYITTYQSAYDSLNNQESAGYSESNTDTYTVKRMFKKAKELAQKNDNDIRERSSKMVTQKTDTFIAYSSYTNPEVTSTRRPVIVESTNHSASSPLYYCAACEKAARESGVSGTLLHCRENTYTKWIATHTHRNFYGGTTDYVEEHASEPFACANCVSFSKHTVTEGSGTYTITHKHISHYIYNYEARMNVEYGVMLNPEIEENIRNFYGLTEEEANNAEANIEAMLKIYNATDGYYDLGADMISPIRPSDTDKVYISSGYGSRLNPTGAGTQFHNAVDIAGTMGTPLLAICDAQVVKAGMQTDGFGYLIKLRPLDEDGSPLCFDGYPVYVYYGHCMDMAAPGVTAGATVRKGQVVAYLGNTGNSTGPHLHLELRVMNPNGSLQDGTGTRYSPVDPMSTISGLSEV